jgi:hypothetical protein
MKLMVAKHCHSSDHTWQSCEKKNPVFNFYVYTVQINFKECFSLNHASVHTQTLKHHVIMFQAMAFSPTAHRFTKHKN